MPEITIGSLDNVPDHSPLTSPWAQDVSRHVVHKFATIALRNLWTDRPLGAVCTVDTWPGVLHTWNGSAWMATQHGYVVLTTDANSAALLTWTHAFSATPIAVHLSGDGVVGYSVLIVPAVPGLLSATNTWLYARIATVGGGFSNVPATGVGIYWSAYGAS